MRRLNVFRAKTQYLKDDPEGYRAGMLRIGGRIGASMLGATVYELPPGESICPYHYEHGNEEWLFVLEGTPTLRHPGGNRKLEQGDVVCFPVGPRGAHKVTNRSRAAARILMLSTKNRPALSVYPDSDKLGVWSGLERDNLLVRRGSRVDYWEGEA